MARRSKRDWLIEGLRVLAESGSDALTIDILTQRLGVTKGSFYHHFAGVQAFIDALLAYYEAEGTLNVIEATDAEPDARARLRRLLEITTQEPLQIEVVFRAWALQNPQVREVQQRIDQQRIAYLVTLCSQMTASAGDAESFARLLYLVYVGSQQIVPPLPPADVQRLYSDVARFFHLD